MPGAEPPRAGAHRAAHEEAVAVLLRDGRRLDAHDADVKRVLGPAGEGDLAGPALENLADVALLHFQLDVKRVQFCNFHQHVAGLHRGADALAQIALHHHPVGGRANLGALQPVKGEVEAGLRLGLEREGHAHVSEVAFGLGLFGLAGVALQVGAGRGLLQQQVARVEPHQRLPGFHEVARPHQHLAQVAVEGRGRARASASLRTMNGASTR